MEWAHQTLPERRAEHPHLPLPERPAEWAVAPPVRLTLPPGGVLRCLPQSQGDRREVQCPPQPGRVRQRIDRPLARSTTPNFVDPGSAERGRGLASRALATAAAWAFDEVGLFRLELGHRVNNPPSCRVANAAGFIPEGIERAKLRYGDARFDVATHARLRTDPTPAIATVSVRT